MSMVNPEVARCAGIAEMLQRKEWSKWMSVVTCHCVIPWSYLANISLTYFHIQTAKPSQSCKTRSIYKYLSQIHVIYPLILLHDPGNFWFCQDTSFSMLLLWVTSVVASSPAKWRSLESWALKNIWRKKMIGEWNPKMKWKFSMIPGNSSSVLGYTLD